MSLSKFLGTGLVVVFGALCLRGIIYFDMISTVDCKSQIESCVIGQSKVFI